MSDSVEITSRRRGRLAGLAAVAVAAVLAVAVPSGDATPSAAAADPTVEGQWSAPQAWPIVAVHMSLEPTGKVLAFDGFDAELNSERLWDPATNLFDPVPYGRNLFCAGHIQLPDGRTLIVGGHISADNGLADTTIFNPVNKTWFRGPDMSVGRWYPTATQLPDGRVLVFSGDNIVEDRPGALPPFSDASVDSLPAIYNPATNTWTDLTAAKLTSPLYPYMFVLSDGRVFDAGPDKVTRILDQGSATWSTVATSHIDGMSAVMYRPNKIMKSGSWADPDMKGASLYQSTNRTEVIDMSAGSPTWRETAPMAFGRAYHTLTILPDGKVLASGGGSQSDGVDLSKSVLPAEIWDPDTETWTTVAALQNGRLYHSTALLLPDGRVLMAGGGAYPGGGATDQKNAELYSPPYLFKGTRPSVTAAPSNVSYGASFSISTPDAASITKVSLLRSASVTHAFDQNQRFMWLNFTQGSGSITVQAPTNANLAPPGDYLIYILNSNGVPSVGKFVRIGATADTTAPTAPTGLTATAGSGSVALTWLASTDDTGVARYEVHRSTTAGFTPSGATLVAQPIGTSYTDTGLGAGTYYYKVVAVDAAGNSSPPSNEATATIADGPSLGLVGAWAFDETSGTSAADATGTGHTGTLNGPVWTTGGKFGGALSFDGVNDWVTVADANDLDLTNGMTLEAWVNPSALGAPWRTVVFKEASAYYAWAMYANTGSGVPSGNAVVAGADKDVRATSALPLNAWSHLAVTFDGSAIKLFVNGNQVGTLLAPGAMGASSGALRIGGNNIWPEWFAGLIDEVRVYNRALTQSQIQSDMTRAIGVADTSAPTQPGTPSATGSISSVALSWAASTDNVGVAHYDVHRSTTSGFTPSTSNRIAQPTGTSYTDSGLAAGTYFYKVVAADAAGNLSTPSGEATATVTGDVTAPSAPGTLTATAGAGQISLAWGAASDNVGVARYNVHRGTTAGFTPTTANRVAQPTGTSYVDSGLATGVYYYRVTAEDASGNVGPASNEANAAVSAAPPTGLVAAWAFDEGSGTTAADATGKGHTATINGPVWNTGGRFGQALSFDGVNDIVNVADANDLDLTTGMTLEAWVRPTTLGNAWRTVLMKEQAGDMVYDLYANGSGGTKRPTAEVYIGSPRTVGAVSQLTANTWTHLAATYDGNALTMFVNGTQVGQTLIVGSIATSTGALRIGGNTIWSEWYAGLIDEVRIYNRALSATEIQADMNKAVGVADTTPPAAPTNFAKTGSTGTTIATSWTASTDNVGVTGYNLYRDTTQVATVSTTTYAFTGLTCGTSYTLAVEAVDGSGNVSTRTPLTASTDACDTTAPSAPGTVTATPSGTSVALSWTAATDNVGVVRYNVHRSTTSGFTPSTANRIAQPTGTSYTDSGLAAGTYYYKVTAEDAAGNVGPASNEATATISSTDTTPPSAPGSLAASPSGTSVGLTWTAATDNTGVVRYNVHRSTTSGFTPATANRIAQPTGTSYTDSGLAAGTYYYKVTAEDAAGNVGPASNEASATVGSSDTTPPTVSVTAPAAGSTVSGTVSVTANASDNTSVAGVQFKLDGANLGAEDTSAPYAVSWNTTTATNGSHTLTAVARDPSGNQATSAAVGVTVSNTASPPAGLVAAWAFDETSGTSAADATGTGHTGTLNGPVWTTGGKFGGALSFDGVNDWVTVADANDLDLTNGMTLEAWVKPTATGDWRTVVFKEGTAYYTYGLYGNTGTNVPSANAVTGGSDRDARAATAAPVGAWTHVAATYDGTTLRVFVNGAQSGQAAAGGSITTSTGALRIGGNSIWPEWFAGLIDEVRIYNRALSATEIQADMASSIGTPDTSPPTAPTGLAATGGLGQVSLSWTAATDDTGVSRYNVHRGTSSGFVPGAGNLVGQSTTTSYLDQGLAAGTYYYRVTAQDAAGNVGPASNEATAAATADTTAPTVAITAPSAGATVSNSVAVSANASDNTSVAGVQFKLDGVNLGAEDTSAPYAVSWDTTAATNASHTLTAVARDPSGNQTTSAPVSVTVSNTAAPPPTGLVAAYGFDEGAGTSAGDAGPNGNNGTLAGPAWTIGRFGNALQFDGVNDWVTVPDSSSLDITRMTLEAWVYPTTSDSTWRTVVFKEQTGDLVYGMYAQTSSNQPSGHAYVSGSDRVAKGTSPLPVNQWSHLAATYDGSAVRLYVNATLVGTTTISGSISTSTGALRIGGNGVWPEWFTGRLDEIRVYNRALSASEIQSDMTRPAAADALAPTVTATTPTSGAIDIPVSATVTATFSEAMDATSLTSSSFELKDGTGTAVPATVTYDPITAKATLTPSGALVYGTTYTAVVHGGTSGSRAKDMSGNALAADKTWTFSTESAPPPILVLGSTANAFSTYTAEMLRAEGMNDFAMLDVSLVNPVLLSFYDVVVLGDVALTPTQVTTLTNWVTGGGNLIALSPDKQLAGLLGLTDAGSTLADKYLKVDNAATGGAGITSATMQYHGSADRYTLSGATAVATLYSTASAATTNPAVTIRSVGSAGGQAVAFTYDLSRSVALTRQGNPAWAGQERDGVVPIRPDDLFFGAKSGDVQPDWVDVSKLAIPQADEQQRLLVNLITTTAADRKPLPRFWYLPRMAKAVVVMTGDDHAVGGTAGRFDQYKSLSPAGCNVANWECIRSTSYLYPNSPLTNAQAQAYQTDGFEVALHPQTGQPCANWTPSSLRSDYTTQLNAFKAKYTSVGTPLTNRTHCVAWSDWLTMAIVEGENGARLDTNYYHYPGSWIGAVPGFMTGAGFPMRFVDTAGVQLNVFMAHTFMTDESGQSYPSTVNALLDGALGANGYYGAFTANMHTDNVSSPGSDAIVASAQARGVPIISAKQLLSWWEGREASTLRSFTWDGSALTFNVSAPAAANGLRMLLPRTAAGKTLTGVTRDGSPVTVTTDTIKGIDYGIVPASTGVYRASYA